MVEVDPEISKKVHPNNLVRIVRALEVYYLTKKPFSHWQKFTTQKSKLNVEWKIFALRWKRDILYRRVENRVDRLINRGWIEEVKDILKMGYSPKLKSLKTLGYKEIVEYINGCKYDKGKLIEKIKTLTRNYVKRQITWFKKQKNINWIEINESKSYKQAAGEIIDELNIDTRC